MKAIDTNVILRIITGDDPDQARIAAGLIASGGVFVPITVLMETEWVLRSFYRWDRGTIAASLLSFAAMDGVEVAQASMLGWMVDRYRHGGDFADMIHIVAAGDSESFVTFDQAIATAAGAAAPVPVETLGV